ncbi:MAG: LuxR C-terminal-related transcriptional regulator [Sulfitobacter sp.]
MANVGTPAFFAAYRALFRARMRFGTFLIIRFDPGKPPLLIDTWMDHAKLPASALSDYVENTYPFDPFFQHRDLPQGGGFFRLEDIAPDRFFFSEYYLKYYRRTGLCDELGMLVPLPSGATAHLSISRLDETGPFKRREIRCLRHQAPILLELLSQHCAAIPPQQSVPSASALPPLADLIRHHISAAHGTDLTRRECQIAGLVLQGHSNASAGLTLGISRETCKVHRRNLYRKLEITSQHDLFGVLKHLL